MDTPRCQLNRSRFDAIVCQRPFKPVNESGTYRTHVVVGHFIYGDGQPNIYTHEPDTAVNSLLSLAVAAAAAAVTVDEEDDDDDGSGGNNSDDDD